ncbi:imidazole glycerol phosphate synthase subunit HisH [Candidatus Bathyarchaeota archaeon]|nr:MAG: imidazole glycerol phosphate synthase subunit HisH [Candidatus Hecatellales archaeon]RLI34335.1 MAG: imidazole glycerol phosphate synthase subunit HisH [Candidatus Bathyarchaeota archaeon]
MKPPKVAILDYGVGNLLSIKMGIQRGGGIPHITRDLKEALTLDALILPGVGAFKPAMSFLQPYKDKLLEALDEGKPLLGICLGMQLLFSESLEGGLTPGLNIFKGRIVPLPEGVKKPHMGWNSVKILRENPLLQGIPDGEYFYFVHSYYPETSGSHVLASTSYGVDFPCVVGEGKIFGTQFHPEKSGPQGLRILKNFIGRIVDEG